MRTQLHWQNINYKLMNTFRKFHNEFCWVCKLKLLVLYTFFWKKQKTWSSLTPFWVVKLYIETVRRVDTVVLQRPRLFNKKHKINMQDIELEPSLGKCRHCVHNTNIDNLCVYLFCLLYHLHIDIYMYIFNPSWYQCLRQLLKTAAPLLFEVKTTL